MADNGPRRGYKTASGPAAPMVSLERPSVTTPAVAPRQRGAERFLLLLAALVSAAGSSALPA
ncbi:MAG: hypothetical protein ACKOPN_00720, partial [Prochlorococcaceae cyanobacterium]